MKISTPCEEAYKITVPALRTAIAKELIERGLSVVKASKIVGISAATYEKNIKEKSGEIEKILSDEEIRDMIEALVSRILANQTIESTSFCFICSKVSKKIFNLQSCFDIKV